MTTVNDRPDTIEVAIDGEHVVINYRALPGPDGWGHLSFTPEQAIALINTLDAAVIAIEQKKWGLSTEKRV